MRKTIESFFFRGVHLHHWYNHDGKREKESEKTTRCWLFFCFLPFSFFNVGSFVRFNIIFSSLLFVNELKTNPCSWFSTQFLFFFDRSNVRARWKYGHDDYCYGRISCFSSPSFSLFNLLLLPHWIDNWWARERRWRVSRHLLLLRMFRCANEKMTPFFVSDMSMGLFSLSRSLRPLIFPCRAFK